jgi:hypothetical protein
MERLDEAFLDELEGRIDETFKETQAGETEVNGHQPDAKPDYTDTKDSDLGQDAPGGLAPQDNDTGVIFDLTEQEVLNAKQVPRGPRRPQAAGVSSRRYHPMEIATNVMVTRENVEFAVRKFVKDLKECLRISKAVSIRFEIKTLDEA